MRCSKCILPDTVPGITFNEEMVCNFCEENFPSYGPKGDDELSIFLNNNIRVNSKADCLVGLSGGKDSTYSLIMLKEKFNMRVEAFTYVHEGSTEFSLQNAKDTCDKLGIKHHVVSLSNQRHLKTFTGFFKAWIKSPSATTAGMTCVACKHLHLLGLDIAKERNIPMIVWSNSPLEYAPFLALKMEGNNNEQMKREGNVKGSILLAKEFVKTIEFPKTFLQHFPTCFNGCLAAFPTSKNLKIRYPSVTPLFFYEFHNWNPKVIIDFIQNRVDWNKPNNIEDWHSDCLFNYFKEYMFLSMHGASYTDAFLSNQIRYGLLSRVEALEQLEKIKKNNYNEILKAIEKLNIQHLNNHINRNIFLENII